jgi:hypothetical protein
MGKVKDGARPPAAAPGRPASPFWRKKELAELVEAQGVRPVARLEDLLGKGAELWDSDENFERFLDDLARRRRGEGRA